LEDFLDSISRDEVGREEYLKKFYFGDGSSDRHNVGLKARLAEKIEAIDPKVSARFLLGVPEDGEHREEVFVRVGKFGPYIEQGERTASIPDGTPPDEMDLETAMELLESSEVVDEPIGSHPETGKPIYLKVGRFGPYIQLGEPDDEEKRNQGLLQGMEVGDVTVELACKLLELPRTLGDFPENGKPIQAFDGRYGPYVKCEKETRSLPTGVSPLEVTLDEAITLLKQPKKRGKGTPKEPLRLYEQPSPVTEKEVKILDGRFGPYVTDGVTNASLRKGMDAKEMKFEAALDLLAERAAKGPTKRKKKATKKKATKKKAAKKKATKKKAKKKGVPKKKS
jgi:DNA topoisomerase-1